MTCSIGYTSFADELPHAQFSRPSMRYGPYPDAADGFHRAWPPRTACRIYRPWMLQLAGVIHTNRPFPLGSKNVSDSPFAAKQMGEAKSGRARQMLHPNVA